MSHSSRDTWLAGLIADKIRGQGITVWLDEMSLRGGEQVLAAIVEGMGKADESLVLVSNESLKSQWVAVEVGMAIGLKKYITPLLNNVDHDAMAPLQGLKAYELNQFEKYLTELKKRSDTHGA